MDVPQVLVEARRRCGQLSYYPDQDEDDHEPGRLETLLASLFPAEAGRHPTDAGEHMLRDIAMLGTALSDLAPESVLLIRIP